MLRRASAYHQHARRKGNRFSWQQEDRRAAAYVEDEDVETGLAYDDEPSDYDEDASANDLYDADNRYSSAFEEDDGNEEDTYDDAYQADAFQEEDEEAAAQDEQQWENEDQWDEAQDDEAEAEERGLVPFHGSKPMPVLRGPNVTAPIFIAGRDKAARPGSLGHTPLALRAHRPRPFFMHAFAVGAIVVSLLATAFALVPLSVKQDMLAAFKSLASFAAPPAPNIPFHWYSVHYGDTLDSIAQHFRVQPGGILEINNLVSADQLYIGMNIKIPNDSSYGANMHPLLNIPMTPATIPPPPYDNWVVPPGFNSFAVQDYYGDPWAGAFGQCTWWAHHKRPDENLDGFGDAWNWANAARAKGMTVTTTPVPNATVVFSPGTQGALNLGHVAHVEQILSGGWVLISEMNFFWNGGGFARVDYRYISPGPGVWFIS